MTNREKSASKNIISNIFVLFVITILTFIVRYVFIKYLGNDYLGLNGLYSNILSMLSLSELGLSTAIGFSLYKYLSNNNISKINKIVSFYKKIYRNIGIVILILGMVIIPFIGFFITGSIIQYYKVYFLFYLVDTVLSYFICYKDVLIISDQKNYIINNIRTITMSVMYILQIIVLLIYKNYISYLIIFVIINNISKLLINIYISKKYSHIDFNCKEKLDDDDKKNIKTNVFALFFHKIGDYLVNGTDNLLISKIISIGTVGLYANYLSIISVVKSLISTIFNAITSVIGELVVKESKEVQKNVFNICVFSNFCISSLFMVELMNCMNTFITIWIGDKYVLDFVVVIVICINLYLYCVLLPIDTFKSAAGIYEQDKYIVIIQSVINLLFSILLGTNFGLIGVLLGTTISYLTTVIIVKPIILYKNCFNSNSLIFFLKQIIYFISTLIVLIISKVIISKIIISNLIVKLFVDAIITLVVYSIMILCYSKTNEFQYLLNKIKK